jgi:hypothetical protein
MWNPEAVLSFVRKRLEAAEQGGAWRSEEEMRVLRSARSGELFALTDLLQRLGPDDNPYQMLAKIRETRARAPQEIDGDELAAFQYGLVCLEVSGIVRNYLDELEMNTSTPVSIGPR